MNFKNYQKEIRRTLPNLGNDFLNQLHMVVGISTEAGEILDVFKKNLAYEKDIDWVNVEEEIGDLCWYLFNLMNLTGINFETVLDKNIKKLLSRYKEGFSREDAILRDLKKERNVLEQKNVTNIAEFGTQLELFNLQDF